VKTGTVLAWNWIPVWSHCPPRVVESIIVDLAMIVFFVIFFVFVTVFDLLRPVFLLLRLPAISPFSPTVIVSLCLIRVNFDYCFARSVQHENILHIFPIVNEIIASLIIHELKYSVTGLSSHVFREGLIDEVGSFAGIR
jgi:hypothetical protein